MLELEFCHFNLLIHLLPVGNQIDRPLEDLIQRGRQHLLQCSASKYRINSITSPAGRPSPPTGDVYLHPCLRHSLHGTLFSMEALFQPV